MNLNISVNPNDLADVECAIQFLRGLVPAGPSSSPVTVTASASAMPLGVVPIGEVLTATVWSSGASVSSEPKAEAPRRTRKPKEDAQPAKEGAAAAVGKPSEAATSAPTTDTSTTAITSPQPEQPSTESSAASATATPDLTLDDARNALRTYTQKHGMDAGIALLQKFGAGRISELPAEKYGEFVKECAE